MDVKIYILRPNTLGNLEKEDITNWEKIPMLNDFEDNPIMQYMPQKLKIDGKLNECTLFYLNNGCSYYSPLPLLEFAKQKHRINNLIEQVKNEKSVTFQWSSSALNGKSSSILN